MKLNHTLIILVAVLGLTNCSSEDEPSVTQQLEKIETSYVEGVIKVEENFGAPKVETSASRSYINQIMKRIDSEMANFAISGANGRTAAITTDYDIGVPVSATSFCQGERITIFMDCEDSTPETWVSPSANAPWPITSGNITMYFCRVDGRDYGSPLSRYSGQHAVLKLGALNSDWFGGTSTVITRHFDNEDRNNKNSKVGNITPNVVDSNTTLLFTLLPALPNSYPVSFGSYDYVIGNVIFPMAVTEYNYFIDDEDRRNANYWQINGTTSSGVTFMSGSNNSSIKILKKN